MFPNFAYVMAVDWIQSWILDSNVVSEDYDLCGTCHEKNIHAEHEMNEIKGSSDQNVYQFIKHVQQLK